MLFQLHWIHTGSGNSASTDRKCIVTILHSALSDPFPIPHSSLPLFSLPLSLSPNQLSLKRRNPTLLFPSAFLSPFAFLKALSLRYNIPFGNIGGFGENGGKGQNGKNGEEGSSF